MYHCDLLLRILSGQSDVELCQLEFRTSLLAFFNGIWKGETWYHELSINWWIDVLVTSSVDVWWDLLRIQWKLLWHDCFFWWWFLLLLVAKSLSQRLHEKGLSARWTRRWLCMLHNWLMLLPQMVHSKTLLKHPVFLLMIDFFVKYLVNSEAVASPVAWPVCWTVTGRWATSPLGLKFDLTETWEGRLNSSY